MADEVAVLRLTEEFDGLAGLALHGAIELSRGEGLRLEGDYASGLDRFLEHLSGARPSRRGTKFLRGEDVSRLPPEQLHRRGLRYVTGRRKLIGSLTVAEHVQLRTMSLPGAPSLEAARRRIAAWIPALASLFDTPGANLSGGQQQLAMLGVAAIGSPTVLVVDEPFLGLAPEVAPAVKGIFDELRREGTALVIAQQDGRGSELADFRRLVFSPADAYASS
jgi:branched-chain amino acid transport system ATP-binding protein